jgi:hypothetical protein
MMGPLMLALSMWVYGQTGSTGQSGAPGQAGGGYGQQGQAGAQAGGTYGQQGQGTGSVNQPTAQPGENSPATQGDVTNGRGTSASNNNGGKTLKGCIRSEGGQYMLEEKGGKMAALSSSEDLSSHVGHQVKVHGNWQKGGVSANNSGMSASTSPATNAGGNAGANTSGTVASGSEPGNASGSATASTSGASAQNNTGSSDNASRKMDHSGKTFQVSNLEMVSETCNIDTGKSNKNSNSGNQGMGQQGGASQSQPPQR